MQAVLWIESTCGHRRRAMITPTRRLPLQQFDAGAPKKFVIDPHNLLKRAA